MAAEPLTLRKKSCSFCRYRQIRLSKQKVDVRLTGSAVEIYFCGTRVASHLRLYGRPNQYSTLEEHMPPEHTAYLQWNSERFLRWASSIGENTAAVVRVFLTAHKVEQQGYNPAWPS